MNKKKVQGKVPRDQILVSWMSSEGPSQATGGMEIMPPVASEGGSQATGGMEIMPRVASDPGPGGAGGG
jgi:hypothetical protein